MIDPDPPGPAGGPSPAIPPRWALTAGVFAITWAAILIRWAEAPALAIAFWRMALALAILAVAAAALRVPFWRSWRGVDWWTGAGAALLLALHFAFWIASLEYTTVASSVVLVSTQPIFVALLGWALLKERPAPAAWVGIVLALIGSAVVAGADLALDRRALTGDLLALLGAVWISFYYVLARWLRATKDLLPYVVVIYGATAAWLLLGALLAGVPVGGFDGATWVALLLLAAGPTVLGHSSMNYALRYLRAYEVNVAILGEPVGAALWAALLLSEAPGPGTWVGGGLILAGIFLTLRRRRVTDEVAAANL
ncbi:MAG: DMT family transporter [Gemmatimonadetes bacterium]|nr:DMT family transporter [Gemmatimonadota bacterium]